MSATLTDLQISTRPSVGSGLRREELIVAELTKEYRAIIRVKLTDELLPSPVLSKEELQELIVAALNVGGEGSPVVSLVVHDRR